MAEDKGKREFVRGVQHFAVDHFGLEEYFPEIPPAKIDPEDTPERVTIDMSDEAREARERGRRP